MSAVCRFHRSGEPPCRRKVAQGASGRFCAVHARLLADWGREAGARINEASGRAWNGSRAT